jgi:hypothetical protein
MQYCLHTQVCGGIAEIKGLCARCYTNERYHAEKGKWHLRRWASKVELKNLRLKMMLTEAGVPFRKKAAGGVAVRRRRNG